VLARILPQPPAAVPGAATARASGPAHARLPRLARCLLVVIGIGYLGGLGRELAAPAAPPQGAALTAWLESHRLLGVGQPEYPGLVPRAVRQAPRFSVRQGES
jgi:hypothetical protein